MSCWAMGSSLAEVGAVYVGSSPVKRIVLNGTTLWDNAAKFALVGSFSCAYSNAGSVFTQGVMPSSSTYGDLTGVAFGNGIYLACGTNCFLASEDGVSYTKTASPNGTMQSVCYADGKFVSICNNTDRIYRSADGVNLEYSECTGSWRDICHGNGKFYICSGNGRFAKSDDAVTWSKTDIAGSWRGIGYGNDTIVMTEHSGSEHSKISTSTDDGATWTDHSFTGKYDRIAYGDGIFLAVGNPNSLAYSKDGGATWNALSLTGEWKDVAYRNGRFYSVSNDYKIAVSPDPELNWDVEDNWSMSVLPIKAVSIAVKTL